MTNAHHHVLVTATLCALVVFSVTARAIENAQQAIVTPAYEKTMRTLEMMHKLDADGDGRVSQHEAEEYFHKLFVDLDRNRDGVLDKTEWAGAARNTEAVSMSNGGYARALSSMAMMNLCDADHDHKVTEAEFLTLHQNLFDRMATGQPAIDVDHWVWTAQHLPIAS
jgi:EF hand